MRAREFVNEDLTRRGFLRGLGAATVAGAAGSALAQNTDISAAFKNMQQDDPRVRHAKDVADLANAIYQNMVAQRGQPMDRQQQNTWMTIAHEKAAARFSQYRPGAQPPAKPVAGFPSQGSEYRRSRDIDNFESVAEAKTTREEFVTEAGMFGIFSKPAPVKKRPEPVDAFSAKLIANRMQQKPPIAGTKKPEVQRITRYAESTADLPEGIRTALGAVALAGTVAMSPAQAQTSGNDLLPDIVAHVVMQINGKTVEKEINLGTQYQSPGEARDAVAKWLKEKGVTNYQINLERATPVNETANENQDAVERAILNRIMVAHTDLLMQFGPDKVMQAAEEVAYNVGDVDEIGTSDVSAYVNQVRQILGAK